METMSLEPEDIRPFIQEALTRRKTEEQAHLQVRARYQTWLAAVLWAAVLLLLCLSVPKMLWVVRQIHSG